MLATPAPTPVPTPVPVPTVIPVVPTVEPTLGSNYIFVPYPGKLDNDNLRN